MCQLQAITFVFLISFLQFGCAANRAEHPESDEYIAQCQAIAEAYRKGRFEQADFDHMIDYFNRRIGRISTADLMMLLGQPRVVKRGDMYYTYALALYYDLDVVSDPEWPGGDDHDLVLHYGEYGPPEHRIPDESFNLFFIIKDDKVVGIRTLFP